MKKPTIKTVFSHTFVYLLESVAQNLISLLLLPIFTRLLVPSDYGILSILEVTGTLVFLACSLGQVQSINRLFHAYDTLEKKKEIVFNVLLFSVCAAVFVSAGLIAGSSSLSVLLFSTRKYADLVSIMAIGLVFQIVGQLGSSLQRSKLQSTSVVIINISILVITIILNIAAVAWLHWGVKGVVLAQLAGKLLRCALYAPYLVAHCKWVVSTEMIVRSIKFGLPFIPHNLAAYLLFGMDRYFLKQYASLDEIGLYSVAYRFGLLLNFVNMAFQNAWFPSVYALTTDEERRKLIVRLSRIWFILISAITILLIGYIPSVYKLCVAENYYNAIPFIGIIAIGYFLLSMDIAVKISLTIKDTSYLFPIGSTSAVVSNAIFNVLLIPRFHALGAAYATALSYLVYFSVDFWVSQKAYHVPYNVKQYLKYMLVFFSASAITYYRGGMLGYVLPLMYLGYCMYELRTEMKFVAQRFVNN